MNNGVLHNSDAGRQHRPVLLSEQRKPTEVGAESRRASLREAGRLIKQSIKHPL